MRFIKILAKYVTIYQNWALILLQAVVYDKHNLVYRRVVKTIWLALKFSQSLPLFPSAVLIQNMNRTQANQNPRYFENNDSKFDSVFFAN